MSTTSSRLDSEIEMQEPSLPPPAYTRYGNAVSREDSSPPAYGSIEAHVSHNPARHERRQIYDRPRSREWMPPTYEDLTPSSANTASRAAAMETSQPKPSFRRWDIWRHRFIPRDVEAGHSNSSSTRYANTILSGPSSDRYTPQGESPITRQRVRDARRRNRRDRFVCLGCTMTLAVIISVVILVLTYVGGLKAVARVGTGGTI